MLHVRAAIRAAEAEFYLGRLSRFEKRLAGSAVTAVETRGKAMLTRFNNGLTLYSASDIEVLTEQGLKKHPFLCRVGPDILDPELTTDGIVDRLESATFRNRALGGLYRDQAFLAGIGNYLRSEILWAAGVDPKLKPSQLDGVELRAIARETLAISRRSYRTRGVTTPPKQAKERKALGMSYGQYRFQVFGRAASSARE